METLFILFLRPLQPHTDLPYRICTSTVPVSFRLLSLPGCPRTLPVTSQPGHLPGTLKPVPPMILCPPCRESPCLCSRLTTCLPSVTEHVAYSSVAPWVCLLPEIKRSLIVHCFSAWLGHITEHACLVVPRLSTKLCADHITVTDIGAGREGKAYKACGLGKGPEVATSGLMGRPQACSPQILAPWRRTESFPGSSLHQWDQLWSGFVGKLVVGLL